MPSNHTALTIKVGICTTTETPTTITTGTEHQGALWADRAGRSSDGD
jgi:hypothetical protein